MFCIPCCLLKSSNVHKYLENTEKNDVLELKNMQLLCMTFFLHVGLSVLGEVF